MLAFIGLGTQEIVLLAILFGIPAVIVVVVLTAVRRTSSRTRALEDENERLRRELDRSRDKSA